MIMQNHIRNNILDVIAPSGKVRDPQDLPRLENYIKSLGFEPRPGKNLLGDHAFLANTAELRFADLKAALLAPDSTFIWTYRGGSGAAELLPLLDTLKPSLLKLTPKILLGFSDITALHIYFQDVLGWETFHGSAAGQLTHPGMIDESSRERVNNFLTSGGEKLPEILLPDIKLLNNFFNIQQPIKITGGNLAVISHLLGTPYAPNTQQKILLLEDINEPAYKIRRMLVQLKQAGLFNNIAGILLGQFLYKNSAQELQLIQQELQEFSMAHSADFPVFMTPHVGHGTANYLLPLGREIIIQQKAQNLFFDLRLLIDQEAGFRESETRP